MSDNDPWFSVNLQGIMQGDRNKTEPEEKERGHWDTVVS